MFMCSRLLIIQTQGGPRILSELSKVLINMTWGNITTFCVCALALQLRHREICIIASKVFNNTGARYHTVCACVCI